MRSYFARAHMRAMSVGDAVLFHHSNAKPPGVAGTARVVRTQVVDETQFDPSSKYFDPKATREAPTWDCVEVEYVATLPYYVSLDRIRAEPALGDMLLLRRGMRLSVQPVTEAEYAAIVALGEIAPPPADQAKAGKAKPAAGKAKPAAGKTRVAATATAATAKTGRPAAKKTTAKLASGSSTAGRAATSTRAKPAPARRGAPAAKRR